MSALKMADRHYEIVRDILEKYAFTFGAFGSRVVGIPKRFSDLDLCFFENIPGNILSHIEEDFEESDLPYKVDLVDWSICSADFRDRIRRKLLFLQSSPDFLRVEENLVGHFKYLPQALGFSVTESVEGTLINCGLGSSMFNIVCASNLR